MTEGIKKRAWRGNSKQQKPVGERADVRFTPHIKGGDPRPKGDEGYYKRKKNEG